VSHVTLACFSLILLYSCHSYRYHKNNIDISYLNLSLILLSHLSISFYCILATHLQSLSHLIINKFYLSCHPMPNAESIGPNVDTSFFISTSISCYTSFSSQYIFHIAIICIHLINYYSCHSFAITRGRRPKVDFLVSS
jgi:hypothetical protein